MPLCASAEGAGAEMGLSLPHATDGDPGGPLELSISCRRGQILVQDRPGNEAIRLQPPSERLSPPPSCGGPITASHRHHSSCQT